MELEGQTDIETISARCRALQVYITAPCTLIDTVESGGILVNIKIRPLGEIKKVSSNQGNGCSRKDFAVLYRDMISNIDFPEFNKGAVNHIIFIKVSTYAAG